MKNFKKTSVALLMSTALLTGFTSCIKDDVSPVVEAIYQQQAGYIAALAAVQNANALSAQADAALTDAQATYQLALAAQATANIAALEAQTVLDAAYAAAQVAALEAQTALDIAQAAADINSQEAQDAIAAAQAAADIAEQEVRTAAYAAQAAASLVAQQEANEQAAAMNELALALETAKNAIEIQAQEAALAAAIQATAITQAGYAQALQLAILQLDADAALVAQGYLNQYNAAMNTVFSLQNSLNYNVKMLANTKLANESNSVAAVTETHNNTITSLEADLASKEAKLATLEAVLADPSTAEAQIAAAQAEIETIEEASKALQLEIDLAQVDLDNLLDEAYDVFMLYPDYLTAQAAADNFEAINAGFDADYDAAVALKKSEEDELTSVGLAADADVAAIEAYKETTATDGAANTAAVEAAGIANIAAVEAAGIAAVDAAQTTLDTAIADAAIAATDEADAMTADNDAQTAINDLAAEIALLDASLNAPLATPYNGTSGSATGGAIAVLASVSSGSGFSAALAATLAADEATQITAQADFDAAKTAYEADVNGDTDLGSQTDGITSVGGGLTTYALITGATVDPVYTTSSTFDSDNVDVAPADGVPDDLEAAYPGAMVGTSLGDWLDTSADDNVMPNVDIYNAAVTALSIADAAVVASQAAVDADDYTGDLAAAQAEYDAQSSLYINQIADMDALVAAKDITAADLTAASAAKVAADADVVIATTDLATATSDAAAADVAAVADAATDNVAAATEEANNNTFAMSLLDNPQVIYDTTQLIEGYEILVKGSREAELAALSLLNSAIAALEAGDAQATIIADEVIFALADQVARQMEILDNDGLIEDQEEIIAALNSGSTTTLLADLEYSIAACETAITSINNNITAQNTWFDSIIDGTIIDEAYATAQVEVLEAEIAALEAKIENQKAIAEQYKVLVDAALAL